MYFLGVVSKFLVQYGVVEFTEGSVIPYGIEEYQIRLSYLLLMFFDTRFGNMGKNNVRFFTGYMRSVWGVYRSFSIFFVLWIGLDWCRFYHLFIVFG